MFIKKCFQIFRDGLMPGKVMPHHFSFLVDNPLRNLILSPATLAKRLNITPNMNILELGCGPGFFSAEIAKRLPTGQLELMDIQPQMLEKAKRKLEKFNNVKFILTDGGKLTADDSQFDIVFLVAVFGELSNPSITLKEISRVIKPNGLLSISEHITDPDFTSLEKLKTIVQEYGFNFSKKYGWKLNYTANFIKI